MQFSQKSKEHMDQCRFCWMCRHICPIGNATGHERNTARARGMILALVARGGVEYSSDIIDSVYECALCGACTKECVTGWDPVAFTKEARLEAALEGKLPSYVEKMLGNIENAGNAYGIKDIDSNLKDAAKAHSAKCDTLLFIGKDCLYKVPKIAVDAIKILERAGVEFTVDLNEPDSGYTMEFLTGLSEETRQTAINTANALKEYKTVICLESEDAMMFKREYGEWRIDVPFKVKTFTSVVANLISENKLNVNKTDNTYTFNDPVHLARDLEEITPAREILSACGNVCEMLLNGKDTMLGGNLIMNEYMPQVMKDVARDRWTNAVNVGAKILVTASAADYAMLSLVKPDGVEIKTLEEVVLC